MIIRAEFSPCNSRMFLLKNRPWNETWLWLLAMGQLMGQLCGKSGFIDVFCCCCVQSFTKSLILSILQLIECLTLESEYEFISGELFFLSNELHLLGLSLTKFGSQCMALDHILSQNYFPFKITICMLVSFHCCLLIGLYRNIAG